MPVKRRKTWTYTPVPRETQGRARTIQARFELFDQLNPWVYDELVRLARELVQRGHRKLGIGMLVEVIRWQYARSTTDPHSIFKINNDYRSRYARMIEANEPDLEGKFEVREIRTP